MTGLPGDYMGGRIPLPRTGGAPERSVGIVEGAFTDVKASKPFSGPECPTNHLHNGKAYAHTWCCPGVHSPDGVGTGTVLGARTAVRLRRLPRSILVESVTRLLVRRRYRANRAPGSRAREDGSATGGEPGTCAVAILRGGSACGREALVTGPVTGYFPGSIPCRRAERPPAGSHGGETRSRSVASGRASQSLLPPLVTEFWICAERLGAVGSESCVVRFE